MKEMKRKNIYIDLTALYNRKITGLERYGINLYRCLQKKSNINVIPIFRMENTLDDNPNAIIINNKNRILVEQFFLPYFLKNVKNSTIIYPIFPPGILTYYFKKNSVKIIPVIHDTVMWNFSDTISKKAKLYLKPGYDLALKKSDKIITISETVKNELKQLTKKEIINFSNCISDIFIYNESINSNILERLNLKKNEYILSVSTIEPRKNIEYTLKLYQYLKKKGFNKKLVLVGRKGWGYKSLYKKIVENDIIFTGFITDEDLVYLYKSSCAFFLLSKYEGFGMPPLEALACGTQVFVSDIPIFRETLNDSAIFLPLDNLEIAADIVLKKLSCKKKKIVKYSFADFCKNMLIEKLQ